MTTQEISNAFYEGTCKIESVSGADELIAYLEKVSGATMSDSEKETFRNPDITSTPNMQMQISSSSQTDANGTSYYDGEFGILLAAVSARSIVPSPDGICLPMMRFPPEITKI